MASNLLVVDWDYFFPNPLEGGFKLDDYPSLSFDWGHRESRFFIDMVWNTRAATFLVNDLKLPRVTPDWKTFSHRFNLHRDATVYFADSNALAGNLSAQDGGPFKEVWLYDAHHDTGYNVKTFKEWLSKATTEQGDISFTCEDWMLVHHMQDTQLRWRIPTWHAAFRERLEHRICTIEGCEFQGRAHGPFWPTDVDLDAQIDDLKPVKTKFDTVFICRSGAWVPPWEDRKFFRFVESWDRDIEQLDNDNLDRGFDVNHAIAEAKVLREFHDTFKTKVGDG